MSRWMDSVRPSTRRFAPAQDEGIFSMPSKIYLILSRERSERVEGRSAFGQIGRRIQRRFGHSTPKFGLFSESQKGHPLDRSAEFGFVLQIWRLRRRRSRRRGAPCLAPLQRGVGALDQTLECGLIA